MVDHNIEQLQEVSNQIHIQYHVVRLEAAIRHPQGAAGEGGGRRRCEGECVMGALRSDHLVHAQCEEGSLSLNEGSHKREMWDHTNTFTGVDLAARQTAGCVMCEGTKSDIISNDQRSRPIQLTSRWRTLQWWTRSPRQRPTSRLAIAP